MLVLVIILASSIFGAAYGQGLTLLGSYDLSRPADELIVEDDYAYLPDADSGLVVLNISDPENPSLAGRGSPDTRVECIALFGNFICGGRSMNNPGVDSTEFKVINITDPANPVVAAQMEMIGNIRDLGTSGDYVYVLNEYGDNLDIIDMSDPYNPFLANSYAVTGLVSRFQIIDSTAYVITFTEGLRILSIADPLNPTEIGYCLTYGMPYDLYVQGNYAYVAAISDMITIDISVPSLPIIILDGFWITTSGGITAFDNYVIMGIEAYPSGDNYLVAVDVEDPSEPAIVSGYPISSHIGKPLIRNNCIFLPQYGNLNRLLIFDSAITGIEDNQYQPRQMGLLKNYPNPFNARTSIEFSLSRDTEIKLSIFNLLGQEITVLIDGMMSAGEHRISWDATAHPSGIYFSRLLIGGDIQSRKMLYLK
jgi:hypothetical protein